MLTTLFGGFSSWVRNAYAVDSLETHYAAGLAMSFGAAARSRTATTLMISLFFINHNILVSQSSLRAYTGQLLHFLPPTRSARYQPGALCRGRLLVPVQSLYPVELVRVTGKE